MRIAIIGLGPKGLFALERLLHHAAGSGDRFQIDAYEPHAYPGAGPVYSPDQPTYLRMNFRAELVNLWPAGGQAVPVDEQISFVDWREPGGDPYPPRAEVGRYLMDGLELLRRNAPANVRIRIVDEEVAGLVREVQAWTVSTGRSSRAYDHVLIATGHEPSAGGLQGIPSGSVVVARGFALTFIDTALALTEGRGGRFDTAGDTRLRYVSGDRDVGVLIPYSRTGRPMLAKPARLGSALEIESVAEAARAQILGLGDDSSLLRDVIALIAEVAAAGIGEQYLDAAGAALADAAMGHPPSTSLSPAEEMQQSVAIAIGESPPDLPSALGHGWRAVYPALVTRFSNGGLSASEWPAFRHLAMNMERLAFGPSPENMMKLLALVDAGRVDLSHLTTTDLPDADVELDTVNAAPGARDSRRPLLNGLLADGHARVLPHQRGLEVRADGSCVGSDGCVTDGLSAIGRPTEDSVVGNDTLSRTLHPAADLWACAVVESVARPSPAAVA